MMDRFLALHTPEAKAYNHIQENSHWEADHHSLNEALIALCASYAAFSRYISGADLYLMPQTTVDLERILVRYAHDAIHNTIAQSRSPLERGGYSRVCNTAEKSIRSVLYANNNAIDLLRLHRQPKDVSVIEVCESPGRAVATK